LNPVLVFDIETVPDVESLRRLRDMASELSDGEIAELAFKERF
jgi:predicted PolB exonuclease-like 3'-5' exonuclease